MKEWTCVIVLDQDSLLLGKRLGSFMSGSWGLAGGKLEPNETPIDCAKRELQEETNLTATSLDPFGLIKEKRGLHHVYVVKNYIGKVKNLEPNRCEEWEWVTFPSKIKRNLVPAHRQAIEAYKNTLL